MNSLNCPDSIESISKIFEDALEIIQKQQVEIEALKKQILQLNAHKN